MIVTTHLKNKVITTTLILMLGVAIHMPIAHASLLPFSPGEKLTYALRWGNIPAGELQLEIRPMTTINGSTAYHFVMTAKSNAAVDIFCKIRDRIDAYTDGQMTRSVLYKKQRLGSRGVQRAQVRFDWANGQAQFSEASYTHAPVALEPGSFDPLSAFYFTRMAISGETPLVKRPVTDGKKCFIGNARLVGRESVSLSNGRRYQTLVLEPEMGLFGGVFKESKEARLRVWVTDDEKRIPVQIKAKVKVGHFIGELVSAEGV
jgi:hypothetical protein